MPGRVQRHRVLYARREERKKLRQQKKLKNVKAPRNAQKTETDEDVMDRLRQQHQQRKQHDEAAAKKRELNRKRLQVIQARVAIKTEDRIIKSMEKKLKFNKRRKKNNSLPKSFYAEGLGDLLDLVDHRVKPEDDSGDDRDMVENEEVLGDSEEEHEDDDEMDEDEVEEFCDDDEYSSEDGEDGDDEGQEARRQLMEKEEELNPDLLRKIRGQLNRLTSSNLPSISSFIEGLYHQHSLHQVSESICQIVDSLVVIPGILSPLKLVSELTLLICCLHENVAEEVGGHCIHYFVSKFMKLLNDNHPDEDKRVDNVLAILVYFYASGLIEGGLMTDIMRHLIGRFDEKSIQLLLFLLVTIGFIVRKDNPDSLKTIIKEIQLKASQVPAGDFSSKRIDFMVETMTAIKNNNILKVSQRSSGVFNPIERDDLKSVLKNCLKKSNKVSALPGSLSQVTASNRWWIKVGTLLERQEKSDDKIGKKSKQDDAMTDQEEKLCKALRLNTTQVRRSLFRSLISSTDYIEASDRLVSLCPKNQVMEVANVIIQVAIHEKSFNPFYLHVAKRMSAIDRRFKLSFFYAIKDRVSSLEVMKESRRLVFGDLIFHFIKEKIVNLTVLKGLDFAALSQSWADFMKYILSKILEEPTDIMKDIFDRIPKKESSFTSSIRLFIRCFMEDNDKYSATRDLLKAKIQMAK